MNATRDVGQEFTFVTFDIAVAKKDFDNQPEIYKKVIIRLGALKNTNVKKRRGITSKRDSVYSKKTYLTFQVKWILEHQIDNLDRGLQTTRTLRATT